MELALALGCPFQQFHQHLMLMLDGVLPRAERRVFNALSSTSAVVDFLRDGYGVTPCQRCDTGGAELTDALSTVNMSSVREMVNR